MPGSPWLLASLGGEAGVRGVGRKSVGMDGGAPGWLEVEWPRGRTAGDGSSGNITAALLLPPGIACMQCWLTLAGSVARRRTVWGGERASAVRLRFWEGGKNEKNMGLHPAVRSARR